MIKDGHSWFVLLSLLLELCNLVNKLAVIRDVLDLEALPCYRYEVVTSDETIVAANYDIWVPVFFYFTSKNILM